MPDFPDRRPAPADRRALPAPAGASDRVPDRVSDQVPDRAWGRVWLVGAGPGDPDLITVAGLKRLRDADVVVHDRLGAPALLGECRPDALKIDVGKRAGRHALPQEDINALLALHAMAGRDVVRLKGGDPFIFGRGGEEMLALRRLGIRIDVVPGITAASACAAATGIPLTHRGLASEVSLITAHHREGAADCDWARLAAQEDRTLAFYMGLSQAACIADGLLRHGRPGDTPVALVSNGATPRQRAVRCTLDTLDYAARTAGLVSPCLILVGAVAELADPALAGTDGTRPRGREKGGLSRPCPAFAGLATRQ